MDANVDPNWFYSSLAQVAAAIVGLMGAVLGTRLISHAAEMRSERINVVVAIRNIQEMLQDRKSHVGPVVKPIADQTLAPRLEARYQAFTPGSDLQEKDVRSRVKELRELEQIVSGATGGEENLRAQLRSDATALERFADHVQVFRSRLVPRPFTAVVILIAFFAGAGIVWPLSALPSVEYTPLQRNMLLAFSPGVLALIGYFGYELYRLWLLRSLRWIGRDK